MTRPAHNQYSLTGQVAQWADLAQGLRHNHSGRRRAVRMLLGLAAVAVVLLGLVCLLAATGVLA
jgi:hypothetical protein